jgi:hypothetical protein
VAVSASPDRTKKMQTARRPSKSGVSQALLIHGSSRVNISWKVWYSSTEIDAHPRMPSISSARS